MDVTTAQENATRFRRWFESGNSGTTGQGHSIKKSMEDSRKRYRMFLSDYEERKALGLSALASTKSTAIVDNAVVDSVQEYYATDAITFTAEDSSDTNKDHLAIWMTELFRYRAKKNAFWVWHLQSLKSGFVDGMEAGIVRWRKESYEYPDNHFYNLLSGEEISEAEYKAAKKIGPVVMEGAFDSATGQPTSFKIPFEDAYQAVREKKTRVVTDTWEVAQLKPGENLMWDFKNPILDLNRGQWAIVIQNMQKDEILSLAKEGIFNKISEEELKPFLQTNAHGSNQHDYNDLTSTASDPDTVDMGDFNTAEVWMAFEKKNCQWMVSFSLAGNHELKADAPVNDVFFGGRMFDRLPIVLGASDIELWEALGRSIPKLIAPIEDELSDHRNNMNDMAKQASTGKWRINDDSDVDINSLLNEKVFHARPGEIEKMDFSQEMNTVMRAADMTSGDVASLAPVSMADSQLVGRGNARDTLGSVQLAIGGNDKKLNARLLIRNITFMEPIMRIIAEMIMAFETDQTIGKIAGNRAKLKPHQITTVVDGQQQVDFSLLDFDAEVQINAGLGNVPKQQKAAKLMQYVEWGLAHEIPLDMVEIDKQLKVLNGFNEDQFILPEDRRMPPPPPPVEDKMTLNVTFAELLQFAPGAAQALLDKALAGAMQMKTTIKEDKSTSGNGKPSYMQDDSGEVMQNGMPVDPTMLRHGAIQ